MSRPENLIGSLPGEIIYYDFDDFRLDLENERLLKGGEPLTVTRKAFQTLLFLVQNSGKLVEKERLYNELWTESFVEESNLTQYIYLLRKVLGKKPDGESYIETVARRGYRFNADVTEIVAPRVSDEPLPENVHPFYDNKGLEPANRAGERSNYPTPARLRLVTEPAAIEGESLVPDNIAPAERAAVRPRSGRKWLFLLLALTAVIAAILTIYFYGRPPVPAAENASGIDSIAVLPFRPIGQNGDSEKLGLGMADAVITRLSQVQQIPVRPTSAVARYMDQPTSSLAAVGRDLGVDAVLEGTVQREGENVRVSVQLVRVTDGKPIWAELFDERAADIFTLQDSIARKVAGALALKLTPQQWKLLEQRPTQNPQALEAFQLGVYYWNTRTRENLEKAEAQFQRAVDLDPNFARALAMLADTYNLRGYYRFANTEEMYRKGKTAAERALAMDNTLAEAHMALAFAEGDSNAQPRLERAIELAPYNSTARVRYAWILVREGDLDNALAQIRIAKENDPLSPVSNGGLCNMLMFRESFTEAVPACERSLELSPTDPQRRLALANAYFFVGRSEDAIAQLKQNIDANQEKFSSLGSLGFIYAKLGRRAEAENMVRQLTAESVREADLLNDLTLITYALGKADESLQFFRRALESNVLPVFMVRNDPIWKDIRSDRRFIAVLDSRKS